MRAGVGFDQVHDRLVSHRARNVGANGMTNSLRRLWRAAREYPRAYVALALALEVLAAAAISRGPHGASLLQIELGVRDLVSTGRIHSVFLPVGYPAMLGWAELLGSHVGLSAGAAIFAVQTLVMMLIVVAARGVLMAFGGSARLGTTVGLAIGLYPEYVSMMRSLNDTNLVLLNLLLVLWTLLRLQERATWLRAMAAGAALGLGVVVRPNLLLMVVLILWAVWRLPRRKAVELAVAAGIVSVLVYAGLTTAVHGRPFYPHNGPYNLFAGLNPYTGEVLERNLNAEDSIMPALAADGIKTHLDWTRDPDVPGAADPRDERYAPTYTAASRLFVREHPGDAARLTLLKMVTLMRQSPSDWYNEETHHPLFKHVAKRFVVFLLPCWILVMVLRRWNTAIRPSALVVWMVVLYFVPFVLTNADPRFRLTIEGVILLDVARMLYGVYQARVGMAAVSTAGVGEAYRRVTKG